MRMFVSHFSYYCRGALTTPLPFKHLQILDKDNLPDLAWVPAMQRRRLSPFAKMALDVAHRSASPLSNLHLPVVYASRHGDLHRTAGIIDDLANNDPLSPTSFGLSVHNAVIGLYSILTGNTQPMTAISAGNGSLMMALLETYTQLFSGVCEQVLFVYCDQYPPERYQPFVKSYPVDLSCAFVLSLQGSGIALDFSATDDELSDPENQALAFCDMLLSQTEKPVVLGHHSAWFVTAETAK